MNLLSLTPSSVELIPKIEKISFIKKELHRREKPQIPYETRQRIISNCKAFDRTRSDSRGNYVDVYA